MLKNKKVLVGSLLGVLVVTGGYFTYAQNNIKSAGEFESVGSISSFCIGNLSDDPSAAKQEYNKKVSQAKKEYQKALSKAKTSEQKKNAKNKYNNTLNKLKKELANCK